MTDNEIFQGQPKLRKARVFTPANTIKQKVGAGGLDAATLSRAEDVLKNNTIDFKPIAKGLLDELDAAVETARNSKTHDETSVEALIYPAAQFLAQGELFHFPLVSEISDILINFLETISTPPTEETLEIVIAHKTAISYVLSHNMTGKKHPQGAALKRSLTDACGRYYKTRKS
jgi:hypothetical protein